MIRPRCIARFLAFLGGYFWLPCPRCGRMFAGFEADLTSQGIPTENHLVFKMTCCPDPPENA